MLSCIIVLVLLFIESSVCQKCLTTNSSSPQPNTECVLPFIFEDKLRTSCINDSDPDGKFWCSTKTDSNNVHIGGKGYWGYCSDECIANQNVSDTASTDDTESGTYQPTFNEGTCGLYLGTGHILGGKVTKRGELPFLAALGYKSLPNSQEIFYSCGGTLINRRYVITAAHCHNPRVTEMQVIQVVLGDHDLSKDPDCPISCKPVQKFDIDPINDVLLHQDYDEQNLVVDGNDIALIRLPRLAVTVNQEFDQLVMPICLSWPGMELPEEKFIVAGWGRTSNDPYDEGDIFDSGAHSALLRKLEVSLVPDCKSKFPIYSNITEDKYICAGGSLGRDSCSGDSGGPLISQSAGDFKQPKYLYGIVSFGTKRCGEGVPGVYTRITFYLDWIIQHMKP